ncbi:hypothetical protein HJD18_11375 [Thermoleophilia bacterium SCSIO 60948]|nr:hypothetical protein HJD18_11375 [Thermoleophilia bacterium SCSIO 60948]
MKRWLSVVGFLALFGAFSQAVAAESRGVVTGVKCELKAFAQDGAYGAGEDPLEVSYGVGAGPCAEGTRFDDIRSVISSDVPGDRPHRKRYFRMPHRNFTRLADPPPGEYTAVMAIHLDLKGDRKWGKPRQACERQNRRTELHCLFERPFEITAAP